jgi:Plasmid encoded RepA protein
MMEKKLSDLLGQALPPQPPPAPQQGGAVQQPATEPEPSDEEAAAKLTPVQSRLVRTATEMVTDPAKIEDAMFQHSIFCQTYLPYKNPGDDQTLWVQRQGNASLAIQTIQLENPYTSEWVRIGLPYGTRARLILAYVNTQAVKAQSQVVDVEGHLSKFIDKLGLQRTGRTIAEIKDQLRRITASVITLGFKEGDVYVPINFGIVKSFDLWFPKDSKQKVMWSSKICLSDDYFNSLMKHAIPLDERAIAALSHSAMALDVYTWLVQRLHRIPSGESQFVAWQQLKDQFGQGYSRMDNFKSGFREVLKLVITQYFEARHSVEEIPNKGFSLRHAATPIAKKTHLISSMSQLQSGQ